MWAGMGRKQVANGNSNVKVPKAQELKAESMQATKGRRGLPLEPTDYLLTLREAEKEGATEYRLRQLVDKGEVRRIRRGDKGRVYYLLSEIQASVNRSYVAAYAA